MAISSETIDHNVRMTYCPLALLNHLRIVGIFLLVALAGCGRRTVDYDSIGLVEVTGHVTLDGQPLQGAYVVFESSDNRQSYGTTNADGQYRLNYNSEQTGVMPGPMKVRITNTPPGEAAEEPSLNHSVTPPVPPQYNAQSTLEVIVESDSGQRFDFELKGQGQK